MGGGDVLGSHPGAEWAVGLSPLLLHGGAVTAGVSASRLCVRVCALLLLISGFDCF